PGEPESRPPQERTKSTCTSRGLDSSSLALGRLDQRGPPHRRSSRASPRRARVETTTRTNQVDLHLPGSRLVLAGARTARPARAAPPPVEPGEPPASPSRDHHKNEPSRPAPPGVSTRPRWRSDGATSEG